MKVAKYYSNNDVRLEELPKPQVGPDELLMKMKACGICGSDVMEWYRLKKAPLVLGHEATGEIVEAGVGVKGFKKGDRVFVSHHVPCNNCHYCLAGNHTVCETLQTTNFFPGGFSEYIKVPKINVERGTFLLPDNLSFEEGTFIEPLACVIRGQRQAGLKPGQNLLILGSGLSGLLHLLLAKANGAGRIVATDINQYRLEMAKKLGAEKQLEASDCVIICTSALGAFKQALDLVDKAGTILCFAPTEPGVKLEVPINDFWRNSITITHSYGASPRDLSEAIDLLKKGIIDVKQLITHRINLTQAQEGFGLVAEAKQCLKVIVESA